MRPIDADRLLDFIKFDEKVIAPEEHTAEDIVMMIQTAPTIAPPLNDPLTEAELREMEGEPVYLSGVGLDRWDIFCGLSTNGLACFLRGALPMAGCGKTWVPYRRRPEPGNGKRRGGEHDDGTIDNHA